VYRMLVLLTAFSFVSAADALARSNGRNSQRRTAAVEKAPAGLVEGARMNPFRNLFDAKEDRPLVQEEARQTPDGTRTPAPKVICGTVVIAGEAKTDPRIRFVPPKTDTTFTIRAIQPPVCWGE
jgi:hypothetical protein